MRCLYPSVLDTGVSVAGIYCHTDDFLSKEDRSQHLGWAHWAHALPLPFPNNAVAKWITHFPAQLEGGNTQAGSNLEHIPSTERRNSFCRINGKFSISEICCLRGKKIPSGLFTNLPQHLTRPHPPDLVGPLLGRGSPSPLFLLRRAAASIQKYRSSYNTHSGCRNKKN